MESMVRTGDGPDSEVHVGITICEGPGRYRMVLTRPFHEQGRIVEIPVDEIASIQSVEPTALGVPPTPVG